MNECFGVGLLATPCDKLRAASYEFAIKENTIQHNTRGGDKNIA